MKQPNLKGIMKVKMDHGCTWCETTDYWDYSVGKCTKCGNMDYKYKIEHQDCSLRYHDKSLSKITEKLLQKEDEMTLQKMRTHMIDPLRISVWDMQHKYGCPTCKNPMWWSVLQDRCLKCNGIDYTPGYIADRVHSTRYNCRNSCFIFIGPNAIRICRAVHKH